MKLLELYTSIQGEGPNTGVPIQFVRFAGCNMRCPGWPCDTPQAIFPELYQPEYVNFDVPLIMEEIDAWPRHVCLTGGEPFIQPKLPELIKKLTDNFYNVDIFTNGSFHIPQEVIDNPAVCIVMDWKLQGSGEAQTGLEVRKENASRLGFLHNIKFVVKDRNDLEEARELTAGVFPSYQSVDAGIWVGAVWGQIEDAEIVEYITQHQLPWRLNVQMHNHIWDPQERFR